MTDLELGQPAKKGRNGRGPGRRDNDLYPTPAWQTAILLDRLDLNVPPGAWPVCRCDGADIIAGNGGPSGEWQKGPYHERDCPGRRPVRILEPCVGYGHIVNAIKQRYPDASFETWDIDTKLQADHHRDATNPCWWAVILEKDRPDWVITNPPFSAAFEILRNAYEACTVGVAMLLRVTWLEPPKSPEMQPKAVWLDRHPPDWQITMERTSYVLGSKQDSSTTAWYVWSKHHGSDRPRLSEAPVLRPAWGGQQRMEVVPGRGPSVSML